MTGPAETLYGALKSAIEREFENLGDDEWLNVVYGHPAGAVYVQSLGYLEPDVLVLEGNDAEGDECTVVANVNGFALLLAPVDGHGRTPELVRFVGADALDR
jgi:hypothetical protein